MIFCILENIKGEERNYKINKKKRTKDQVMRKIHTLKVQRRTICT